MEGAMQIDRCFPGGKTCRMLMLTAIVLWSSLPAVGARETGLVAHYTFEEGPGGTVKDWSGAGNHGKNLGAKYVHLGKGYALAFETADAHVDCGNRPSLDLTEELTIALWLKPLTKVNVGEPGVVGKDLDSFTFTYSHTNCWCYINSGRPDGRSDCRTGTVLDSWQHITVAFDGKELKVYRDAELQDARKSRFPGIKSVKNNLYLRYPNLWGDVVEPTFKCMMDDVRIYNRALGADEIVAHYREGAEQKGKDVSSFGRIRLIPHVYPLASTLLIEADYSGLKPVPPGTGIALELWDTRKNRLIRSSTVAAAPSTEEMEYNHTSSVCPMSAVSADDKVEWLVSTKGISAGACEIRAMAKNRNGRQVGVPAAATVTLPAEPHWLKANRDGEVLNNLVIQLLDVRSPRKESLHRYNIINPKEGWVFLSSEAGVNGAGEVVVTLDGAARDAVIRQRENGSETKEAMRYLSAGAHTIEVRCKDDATLKRLVVRAVPELLFDSIGYRPAPWIKCYGPYNWDFFQKSGIMDNVNVLVERSALPENAQRSRDWRAQGKKILSATFTDWLASRKEALTSGNVNDFLCEHTASKKRGLDGTLMSEFDGFGYPTGLKDYPFFADAFRKMARNEELQGKVFYPYGKFMYLADEGVEYFKALLDAGYKFAEEIYMQEQPTEKGARKYLDAMVRQRMLRYQAAVRGCQKGMIAVLAYFSIPAESVNVDPNANYKVFMDTQMNLLANDPVFSELHGVMWYHSAYADEESLRWSAKLLRHYCIEGKRDRLSTDPYELTHVANGDFREGAAGWALDPAEDGSISARHVKGFGRAQGRYPESEMGDYCLLTARSARRPNRFSQRIRNLEPGRLYSVKMFTADYEDLARGISRKRVHQAQIELDGVEVLPERSICEVFTRGHGSYAKEDRKANRWITYRVVFFRARQREARLTISDWASDPSTGSGQAKPGGPIGQQLIHNFIEVEPYLED